jgi:ABC-type Fe3+-hydroxamate transport system substrate-binding protein
MSAPPALPPPRRVVSLVPSLTESLFDLDLGDRLIAISDRCTRPAEGLEALPRVGGSKTPVIAQIVALRPDLVLLNDEENRREDAQALAAAGIPLWVTGPRTVLDAITLLWQIMELFDHTVMVPRVREIERAYDYTLAAARTARPAPVFVPIWRDPWMTFSAQTYAGDMLRVCGGANVFAAGVAGDSARYPQITLDEVTAAQPEVILLPDEPYPFSQGDVAELARLDLPAARFQRIYSIDGSLLMWHGTRAAYALRDLPLLLMGRTSS